MMDERIVAVGFLTESDMKTLGAGFSRHFPVEHDDLFADLVAKLDAVDASALGAGVVIRPPI